MEETSSSNLHHLAIKAALDSRWDDAIEINQEILKVDPQNIDALNRLAHAYFETGDLNNADKFYSETLKYDAYNPIAAKNLKIIQAFKKGPGEYKKINNGNNHPSNGNGRHISALTFLQEPGRTKVVNLLKVAEPQKLSLTYCGMPVELQVKNRGVSVIDESGGYLGVLPDDTAHHLIRLIKGGNKYQSFIKSIKVNGIAILIRETFSAAKFKNQPSFLEFSASSSHIPSTEMLTSIDLKEISQNDEDLLAEEEETV